MATFTKSELTKEAKETINVIFGGLILCEDKQKWKEALVFIDTKIFKLEAGERGFNMFVWVEVRKIMNKKFGAKFITKK